MKKVLVLGLGISGKSVVDYLTAQGVDVVGVDKKLPDSFSCPVFHENDPKLKEILVQVDTIIKSPGIGWDHQIIQMGSGKEILSEVELAFRALQHKNKKILAITGSNGKTTTTMLTTHVLQFMGYKAISCGNIGLPLLSQVDSDADILVIELSSYQIETLETPILDAGIILNITPNHLERYPSFEAYGKAKLKLGFLLKKGGKLFVQDRVAVDFQGDIPTSHHPFPNLQLEENVATIFPLRYRDGRFSHDFENFRAAFALCKECKIEEKDFWRATKSFVKPPHRLEFVRVLKGVTYINDSKATTVDAVKKGMDTISTPVILIAGGIDKGSSYVEWGKEFEGKVRKVLLIGKAQEKLFNEIGSILDTEKVGTLDRAVERASQIAEQGETVLLSPGCASFDQFQSFEHRGDVFKKLVLTLEGNL